MAQRINLFNTLGKQAPKKKARTLVLGIATGVSAAVLLVMLVQRTIENKKKALAQQIENERAALVLLQSTPSRGPASSRTVVEQEKGWYPLVWKLTLGLPQDIVFRRLDLGVQEQTKARIITIEAIAPSLLAVRDWSAQLRKRIPVSDYTLDQQQETPEGPISFKVTIKTL